MVIRMNTCMVITQHINFQKINFESERKITNKKQTTLFLAFLVFSLRARSQYWATKVEHEGQKLKQECVT